MKRLFLLLALLLPVLGLGQGLAINLNAGTPLAAQTPAAKALGATSVRAHAPLWGTVAEWLAFRTDVDRSGVAVLQNLSYADPAGGSEHRGTRGAEVKAYAERVRLYFSLVRPDRGEIGNEPNNEAFWRGGTPQEFAVYAKACVDAALSAGAKELWVGALDGSKPNALAYAQAMKAAGVFADPRVGLSWHLYPVRANGERATLQSLEAVLVHGARLFEGIVPRSRQLVTEIGYQDDSVAIADSAPCAWLDGRKFWTPLATALGPSSYLVDPGKAGVAHYTAKAALNAPYARVTATLWADAEGTALLGSFDGSSAVEVAFGKSPRRVSVVVPTTKRAGSVAFSLIARSAVRVDGISVEPLAWDAARYEAHRLAAKAIAYARVDASAKEIGLAGAFAYTLDDDTDTYGLRNAQGGVKAQGTPANASTPSKT